MRPIIALAATLLFLACENPIDHFTEGPEREEPKEIGVPPIPQDSTPPAIPLPPPHLGDTL